MVLSSAEAENWARWADEEEARRRAKEARMAEKAAADEARMAEKAAADEARRAKKAAVNEVHRAKAAAARRAEHLHRVEAWKASAVAGVNTEIEVSKDSQDSARTYKMLVDLRENGYLDESSSQRVLSKSAEKWDQRRKFWKAREQELLRLRNSKSITFDDSEIVAAIQSAQIRGLIRESVLYVKEQLNSSQVSQQGEPVNGGTRPSHPKETAADGESFLSRLWRKLTT